MGIAVCYNRCGLATSTSRPIAMQASPTIDNAQPTKESAAPSSRMVWICTLAATIYLGVSFALLIVQPNLASYPMRDGYWSDYLHGWPICFMARGTEHSNGGFTSTPAFPWPFFESPALYYYDPGWIIFDTVVAMSVIALVAPTLGRWAAGRSRLIKRCLAALFVFATASWALAASTSWAVMGTSSPMYGNFLLVVFSFTALMVVPSVVLVLAVLVVVCKMMRWAFSPHLIAPRGILPLLFDWLLLAMLLCFVVNKSYEFGRSLPLLSLLSLGTIVILGLLGAVLRMGRSSYRSTIPADKVDPTATNEKYLVPKPESPRFRHTAWLATFVVGWTVSYVSFFERPTHIYVDNGQPEPGNARLEAWGWPWIYMAEYEGTEQEKQSAMSEGYPVELFYWPALWGDLAAVLVITAGTLATLMHLAKVRVHCFRFSMRTTLAVFAAVAVTLSLPQTVDYYFQWADWFIQAVVYLGLFSASLGLMLLGSRTFDSWMARQPATLP